MRRSLISRSRVSPSLVSPRLVSRSVVSVSVVAALAVGPVLLGGSAASATSPGLQNGLVLQYKFETVADGTVVNAGDPALNGRVVAPAGAQLLGPSLSGHGKALRLRGADHEYVDVPLVPALDVDHYTLSAWVRYTGVENDQTRDRWEVLEKAGAYWVNVRTNGRVRVGGFYGGCSGSKVWRYLDSVKALPAARWAHVASTYDGSVLRVYIDGKASGSKRVSGRTCASTEPLAVGAKNNPAKGLLEAFWDGRMDDVRIYDRPLSASEVAQLARR